MDVLQNSRYGKFQTKVRNVSRLWSACGAITLLVLATGCDPCMNNPCDNGLACDGLETCVADGGEAICTDGTPVACEFPTFCTEPDSACVDPCDGADCSDANDCTADSCTTNMDGTTTCVNDTACDDADECTEGDACGDDGVCAGSPIECSDGGVCMDGVCSCTDDSECSDGDPCNGDETCNVETGDCVAGTSPVVCNTGDICEPATGECVADPCFEVSCSGDEFCSDGVCVGCVNNSDCDDGFSCTNDVCDGATGTCTNTAVNESCSDPLFCDGVDVCDPSDADADADGCVSAGDPCSGDTPMCNEETDMCEASSTTVEVGLSETTVSFDHTVGSTSCPQEFGSFLVTNTGNVETMYTTSVGSAPLTTDSPSFTLAPGESKVVAVTFTCAQTTSFTGTITIEGSASGQMATGTLAVTGNVG